MGSKWCKRSPFSKKEQEPATRKREQKAFSDSSTCMSQGGEAQKRVARSGHSKKGTESCGGLNSHLPSCHSSAWHLLILGPLHFTVSEYGQTRDQGIKEFLEVDSQAENPPKAPSAALCFACIPFTSTSGKVFYQPTEDTISRPEWGKGAIKWPIKICM